MNVVFAGTPEFAQVALAAIVAAGHTVPLVLTQPDRPSGRGMRLQASPVKACATAHGIEVIQPPSLRLDGRFGHEAKQAHDRLAATPHDVMVVAAYGLILPREILSMPPRGCLNIHASLLPRWRGAAPIQRAIEAGDRETGVTIMAMEEGLDTGPVLLRAVEPIRDDDTTSSLQDRLAALGARTVLTALDACEHGHLVAVPQPQDGATYAVKIAKSEAPLDFRLPAATLACRVRAFNPFPGATFTYAGQTIKVWHARHIDERGACSPGIVLGLGRDGIAIACGAGTLVVTAGQKPGGRVLGGDELARSIDLQTGAIL